MKANTFILLFFLFVSYLPSIAQYYGVEKAREERWVVGLSAGSGLVQGDIPARLKGLQIGVFGQKSIDRVLDIRLHLYTGQSFGLATSSTLGYEGNTAWNGVINSQATYVDTAGNAINPVFLNYRMQYFEVDFLFKVNLNRLLNPLTEPNWDLYVLGGLSAFMYNTKVDALNGGIPYDFEQISSADENGVKDELMGLLDGDYETQAQQDFLNKNGIGRFAFLTPVVVGFGYKMMLNELIGVGIEGRFLPIRDDLLDGQRWTDTNEDSGDNDQLVSLSLLVDFTF
ncbi:MAG: hypothetical protein AAFR66_20945 [Bacteroidota bacterium]